MFERFTDRARRVVVKAQEEARELGHNYIGTEHLLLGIIRDDDNAAVRVLRSLGVDLDALRENVYTTVTPGDPAATAPGHVPFTPRAKRILEMSLRECQRLRHNHIGTEHLLLALVADGDGVAALVLNQQGVTFEAAESEVIRLVPPGSIGVTVRPGAALGREALYLGASRREAAPGQDILQQLAEISRRLAAIERMLGIEDDATRDEPTEETGE